MSDFLEIVVSAGAAGCVYGLVALAYLLMIRPTGVINFAVGEWSAVGVFAAFWLVANVYIPVPFWIALPLTVLFVGAVGWATEQVAVRPFVEAGIPKWVPFLALTAICVAFVLRPRLPYALAGLAAFGILLYAAARAFPGRGMSRGGAPPLSPILALLGMLVIFREYISLGFGPDPHNLDVPLGIRQTAIGPFRGTPRDFFIIAVTLVVFALTWWFFERTVWGRAFEAVALNRRAAALMGIDLRLVTVAAFAGGAMVAGLAGVLYALTAPRDFLMGLPLAVQGFSALVVGGVGRVEGALLGGFILAFAEQLTARYADQIGIPSGLSLGVPFLLMILFLLLRPTGLLRAKEAA
jgi:branched-chain amino acid transport system permease protein